MKFLWNKLCVSGVILIGVNLFSTAQSVHAPLNQDYYHLLDRYEIKQGRILDRMHSAVKPVFRDTWTTLIDSAAQIQSLNGRDAFNLTYLKEDNFDYYDQNERIGDSKSSLLKYFYRKKNSLFYTDTAGIVLLVNPVFQFAYGFEDQNIRSSFGDQISVNTRGAELRGMLAKKLGFYSFVSENQVFMPAYVDQYRRDFGGIPGEGFIKSFEQNGYDFISARGYISFDPMNYVNFQLGHDKLFIGNGFRSLMLSDFSENQFYVRANATFWKFNYVVHFSELVASRRLMGPRLPKKYLGMHHISMNIGKRLNISLFESIVFGGTDTLGRTTFEPKYLNPIIFYRFVEQQSGSADNALLGMNVKYNIGRSLSLYGAVVIDEFKIDEIRGRTGWWGNKQSFQLGFKYIDAFKISNLDIQGEVNYVRPYMYTHYENNNSNVSYTSYGHPLAHPLGANFYEGVGVIRYQPLPRLWVTGKAFYITIGLDSAGSNWGSNVRLDYNTRERERGNTTTQGLTSTIIRGDIHLSYMLRHNLFLDAGLTYRQQAFVANVPGNSVLHTTFGIRMNIAQRFNDI